MTQRYLMLTTVDVLSRSNNREHQMIAHLAPRFAETWVVFRRRCPRGSLRQVLFDALVPRARLVERGGIKYLEVNPLFNHFEGMAGEATGHREFDDRPADLRRRLRRLLFELISGLGILKDISTMFFLAYFAWRRCPGRFDIATGLGPWGAIAGLALRRMNRIGCLIYEDRDYEPGFIHTALRRRWAGLLERFAMRRADRIIAIGERLAALRRSQTGCAVSVVSTGVDVDRFASPERAEPRPVLVYAGNMAPWSGLDLVLQALPRIRESIPHVRCVFVGSGPPLFRAHLEAIAEALGLGAAVEFVGEVPYARVQSFLAEAGIGLAVFRPTELRQYAAPLKVLEYMAAGLPTIAMSPSEAADLVKREASGVGIPFDRDALAMAVISLLRDREEYLRLAGNARRAAAKFNWSRLMADEYSIMKSAQHRGNIAK